MYNTIFFAAPTEYYAFLGRVMGRALYQGVLIDVTFAAFFLNKWLGRASSCEWGVLCTGGGERDVLNPQSLQSTILQ
jgi:hypothetical protein